MNAKAGNRISTLFPATQQSSWEKSNFFSKIKAHCKSAISTFLSMNDKDKQTVARRETLNKIKKGQHANKSKRVSK